MRKEESNSVKNKPPVHQLSVFDTPIGWFGVLFRDQTIRRIKFGFQTGSEVVRFFEDTDQFAISTTSQPWQKLLEAYSRGACVSFASVPLESEWMTPFQNRVINACRDIPYGSTVTYGQLAKSAGSPGAARAVGSAMRKNRFPIIVPCHRVVGENSLGGFSASRGVDTKKLLLKMEGAINASENQMMLLN